MSAGQALVQYLPIALLGYAMYSLYNERDAHPAPGGAGITHGDAHAHNDIHRYNHTPMLPANGPRGVGNEIAMHLEEQRRHADWADPPIFPR
ncbi:MAG: hypothetical protein CMJ58_09075 [Planctomycetaceae bacterium]|jgi:hypothetical protein|nr:hypothetical protein [Planctomycetaceae bacterium]